MEQFGKYRTLNLQTGQFITYGYSSVTRLVELLEKSGLKDRFSLQIDRIKFDLGARYKILLLHDIGGTLCYRHQDLPEGPNGESNPNFFLRKRRYIYIRPGALEYIRRI